MSISLFWQEASERMAIQDMLVDAFKKGAVEKNKVEVISVRSHDITPCIGCNSCFTRPGNECFQRMICRLYMKN